MSLVCVVTYLLRMSIQSSLRDLEPNSRREHSCRMTQVPVEQMRPGWEWCGRGSESERGSGSEGEGEGGSKSNSVRGSESIVICSN